VDTRIIALDLSSVSTGYCIGDLKKMNIVETGLIQPVSTLLSERFRETIDSIFKLFEKHKCDFVVAEELTFFKNARTVLALAGLRGALSYAVKKEYNLEVIFLTVGEIRKVLNVKKLKDEDIKEATRKVVENITHRELKKGSGKKGYDESDAIAVYLGAINLLRGDQSKVGDLK
jgi:Holliday junction resolvasome RuvABC endonuclease subunit